MQFRPGTQAPGLLHVVPKMVPQRGSFVAGVVPCNPKVARSGHRARLARVVESRLIPSRVVLYRESMAYAASTVNVTEIASGREPEALVRDSR
jgi:hypothetical protein